MLIIAGLALLALMTVAVCYKAFVAGPPAERSGGLPDTVTQQMDRSAPRIPLRSESDSGSGNRMLLLPAEGQQEGSEPSSTGDLPRDEDIVSRPAERPEPQEGTRAEKRQPQRRTGGPIQFPTVGTDRPTGTGSGGYPVALEQRDAGEVRAPLTPFEGGRGERPSSDVYEEGLRQLRPRRSLSGREEGEAAPSAPQRRIEKYSKDGVGERQTGRSEVMPGWVTLDDGRKIHVIEVGGIKTGDPGSEGKSGSSGGKGAKAVDVQKAVQGAAIGN